MNCLLLPLLFVAAASARRAPYVIGGVDTTITDWPSTVSLQNIYGQHMCGGNLVDSTHVVTAAHCVHNTDPYTLSILLGTNNLANNDAGGRPQRVPIVAIRSHPNYANSGGRVGDISVLTLGHAVSIDGTYVSTIELAGPNAGNFVGAECQIAGWGRTEDDFAPSILQSAPVTIISDEACHTAWPHTEGHICFQDVKGVHGACFGDSGGPLICKTADGKSVLAGVTNGGSQNCDVTIPAFYARVSFYDQFIKDNIE